MNWGQAIVEVLAILIPLFLYLHAGRRKAARDNDARHVENSRKLNTLLAEREYLVPHDHIEIEGVLQADGIIRKRKVPNGR